MGAAENEQVGGQVEPLIEVARDERPLRPEYDPFFRPADGYERAAPGTILRAREVETALLGRVPQKFAAWQLLYRTSDLHGAPTTTVTTVLLPAGAAVDEARPLLSYQCAIDAVATMCFPSYALRRGGRSAGSFPPLEFLFIGFALSRGWAVSVPDHEGLQGRWGVPREPGYHVLDGIRAAAQFSPLGLDAAPSAALWGYSGGGLASAWAAEMAPGYAPEINLVGAALGSPVGDLVSTFLRLNGTVFAAFPTLVIAGLRRAYPDLTRIIAEHVSAPGLALLDAAEEQTTAQAVVRLAWHDLDTYTDMPLADLLATPEVVEVFDDIAVGVHRPAAPMLVVQSAHDRIIHVGDVDGLVDRYRKFGNHVTYIYDRLSGHLSLLPVSAPMSISWLTDRFAGRALPAAGNRTVWSTGSLRGLAEMAVVVVKMVFGRPIGLRR